MPSRFKVYPAGADCSAAMQVMHFEIEVFKTRGWMYGRHLRLGGIDDHNFAAIVMPRTIWDSQTNSARPLLGYVLFNEQSLYTEIIAHEAVHMGTTFLRRIRRSLQLTKDIDGREENLAYAIGRCVAQLSNRLHEQGIWK